MIWKSGLFVNGLVWSFWVGFRFCVLRCVRKLFFGKFFVILNLFLCKCLMKVYVDWVSLKLKLNGLKINYMYEYFRLMNFFFKNIIKI